MAYTIVFTGVFVFTDIGLLQKMASAIASFDCQRTWVPHLAEPPNAFFAPTLQKSVQKIKNPASSAGRIHPAGWTCSLLDRSFYPVFVTNLTSWELGNLLKPGRRTPTHYISPATVVQYTENPIAVKSL